MPGSGLSEFVLGLSTPADLRLLPCRNALSSAKGAKVDQCPRTRERILSNCVGDACFGAGVDPANERRSSACEEGGIN